MIAIWDDHEVEDNYARDLPGEETKPEERRSPFLERRAAGYRAWFEHMPRIRVPEEPDRTYGRIPLGANADLFLLDQRQYRDDQPCGDEFFEPCAESEAPGRTYLGQAQKEWLKAGLAQSRAAWKVVGNQAMIMALDGPPRNEINKDQWDGYAAERAELLDHVAATGTKDVTFITGDIHTFFAGNVTSTGRQGSPTDPPAVATEFVGGSMTSRGIIPAQAQPTEAQAALLVDSSVLANNPHIKFSNMERKGYAVMECAPNELRVTYRAARSVETETSEVFDLARFKVDRGRAEVERL
jgi:alkaline phosphatase D